MHVRGAGRGGKRPGAGRKSEAEKREAARADGGPETTEAAAVIGDKARLRAIHADLVQGMGVMDLVRVHGITAPLAKTLTDTYTAALKGLELETETKKLLKVEDARTAWLETLAFVDGVLQNLPGQVAAEVAAMLKLDALAQESVRVKVHAEVERARKQLRAGSPTIVGRPERALAGFDRPDHAERLRRAPELLEMVGLPAEHGRRYAHQFSGDACPSRTPRPVTPTFRPAIAPPVRSTAAHVAVAALALAVSLGGGRQDDAAGTAPSGAGASSGAGALGSVAAATRCRASSSAVTAISR